MHTFVYIYFKYMWTNVCICVIIKKTERIFKCELRIKKERKEDYARYKARIKNRK